MDFSYFFSGAQADLLLMLLAPLACAMFRALFLWRYRTHAFTWPQLAACFRYGFWWGMDFNAYVFLIRLAGRSRTDFAARLSERISAFSISRSSAR